MAASPVQTPGPPASGSALASLRKVPTPVWLVAGGAALGLAYLVMSGRGQAPAADAAAQDAAAYDPTVGDPGALASPVSYVTAPAPADSGETVGAIGQTGLETLGGIFGSAFEAVTAANQSAATSRDTSTAELMAVFGQLIEAGRVPVTPPPGQSAPPGQAPTAAPRPTPSHPAPRLPAGFHRGDTVVDGKTRKRFPGAKGWVRVGSGGRGAKHYVDYRVRYCTVLQRWRCLPNAGHKWSKIHEVHAANICG